MGNSISSYSQKSLFLLPLFFPLSNDQGGRSGHDGERRRTNDQQRQPIPLSVVARTRRRIIISHNNDIFRVLSSHARSIRQTIFIVTGQGYIYDALLSHPIVGPGRYEILGRFRILEIHATFQPSSSNSELSIQSFVQETTNQRLEIPNETAVGVSFVGIEGGRLQFAHRLITSGDVELLAVFYVRGDGPMFEEDAVDDPEAPSYTSDAIRYMDD